MDASRARLIEPILITYNRAEWVFRTLTAFRDAGWHDKIFHVLDNASTDATGEIVASFQKDWPDLKYHRNRWNIGGNANILRALEIGSSEYHWVIGDDDEWHFTTAEEVLRVLAKGKADIVRLGWLVGEQSRGQYACASDLIREERLFFASVSMISATIFRRSLVACRLPEAYQNVGNSYPQLVPVMRAVDDGLVVYTVTRDFMTHTPSQLPGYFVGDLEWYSDWYATSRYLSTMAYRRAFLREVSCLMTVNRRGHFKEMTWLMKVALNAKGLGLPQGGYLLSMLANGRGGRLPVILAAVAYLLVPWVIAKKLRVIYRRMKRQPELTRSADRSRL